MTREIVKARVESHTRDVRQWHVKHIQQGLREATAGKFASEAQVKRVVTRLRKK